MVTGPQKGPLSISPRDVGGLLLYRCIAAVLTHGLQGSIALTPVSPATFKSFEANSHYSCSTSHYIQQLWVRWPLQPLQPFQQTQLQPPFGQSVDSLRHPWFTTTNVSYRFPILKLPPPPCAVLLVRTSHWVVHWPLQDGFSSEQVHQCSWGA